MSGAPGLLFPPVARAYENVAFRRDNVTSSSNSPSAQATSQQSSDASGSPTTGSSAADSSTLPTSTSSSDPSSSSGSETPTSSQGQSTGQSSTAGTPTLASGSGTSTAMVTNTHLISGTTIPSSSAGADSTSGSSPNNSFFHNKAALGATFTILGLLLIASLICVVRRTLLRRRVRRLDREMEEAVSFSPTAMHRAADAMSISSFGGYDSQSSNSRETGRSYGYGQRPMSPPQSWGLGLDFTGVGAGMAQRQQDSAPTVRSANAQRPLVQSGLAHAPSASVPVHVHAAAMRTHTPSPPPKNPAFAKPDYLAGATVLQSDTPPGLRPAYRAASPAHLEFNNNALGANLTETVRSSLPSALPNPFDAPTANSDTNQPGKKGLDMDSASVIVDIEESPKKTLAVANR